MKKSVRLAIFAVIVVLISIGIYNSTDKNVKEMSNPIKYEKYIETYSEKYNLDIFYVIAIIKSESNFDKDAVSVNGARGLMQLTPSTASYVADELGWKKFDEDDLFIPKKNIELGCKHIADLITEFGEIRPEIISAAYNAGSGSVAEWLQAGYYDYDKDEFEKIPFEETRDYVKTVDANYEYYKKLYGKKYAGEYTFE